MLCVLMLCSQCNVLLCSYRLCSVSPCCVSLCSDSLRSLSLCSLSLCSVSLCSVYFSSVSLCSVCRLSVLRDLQWYIVDHGLLGSTIVMACLAVAGIEIIVRAREDFNIFLPAESVHTIFSVSIQGSIFSLYCFYFSEQFVRIKPLRLIFLIRIYLTYL